MNIFVDESGSFVNTTKTDSWNCVAAYISPEVDTPKILEVLQELKRSANNTPHKEIKLKDVTEDSYLKFLGELNKLNGTLFSVATDSSLNSLPAIKFHQEKQVEAILKVKPSMKYDGGKLGVQLLADQLSSLSPQLYAQLHCQVNLIHDIVIRGILYYVQRHPESLGKFSWRVDQKNSQKPTFEETFEKILPALLQTKSLREPMIMLKGADYSAFSVYEYTKGESPTYLKEEYGIDLGDDPGVNLGKLLRDDIKFEDSEHCQGVQIVDLLASGIRRCLRNGFNRNSIIAKYLGGLMVQQKYNKPPINLIGFKEAHVEHNTPVYNVVKEMTKFCRAALTAC